MLEGLRALVRPLPFYEDGYKLIEAPYLGMEHQSAVAYGNRFANGYLGDGPRRHRLGLKFDFIIIHESGHEWFGNNITAKDVADNWIHEGFTTYSEVLFVERRTASRQASNTSAASGATSGTTAPSSALTASTMPAPATSTKGRSLVHMVRAMLGRR